MVQSKDELLRIPNFRSPQRIEFHHDSARVVMRHTVLRCQTDVVTRSDYFALRQPNSIALRNLFGQRLRGRPGRRSIGSSDWGCAEGANGYQDWERSRSSRVFAARETERLTARWPELEQSADWTGKAVKLATYRPAHHCAQGYVVGDAVGEITKRKGRS